MMRVTVLFGPSIALVGVVVCSRRCYWDGNRMMQALPSSRRQKPVGACVASLAGARGGSCLAKMGSEMGTGSAAQRKCLYPFPGRRRLGAAESGTGTAALRSAGASPRFSCTSRRNPRSCRSSSRPGDGGHHTHRSDRRGVLEGALIVAAGPPDLGRAAPGVLAGQRARSPIASAWAGARMAGVLVELPPPSGPGRGAGISSRGGRRASRRDRRTT